MSAGRTCDECVKRDDIESIDQRKAIGALETYVTKALGKLTVPTPPDLFGGEPTSQAEASPLLGEHSRNILIELGWRDSSVDDLINLGQVAITKL